MCHNNSRHTLVMDNGGSEPNALREMDDEPLNDNNAYT
jgi:hypothetical protein